MRALAEALRFLSIIPLPGRPPKNTSMVMAAYPWAGLILGVIAAVFAWGAGWIFGAAGTAVVVVTIRIIITGGLHFDGLADLADGLGGGRDTERRLAIMADSRLGTFGGLALVLMAVLQITVVAELIANQVPLSLNPLGGLPVTVLLPLVVAPVLSRGIIPTMMRLFPSARPGGMGDRNRQAVTRAVVIFTLISCFAGSFLAYGVAGLGLAAFVTLLIFSMAALIARRLGGLTGDVYGALIETGDLIVLFGILILVRLGWDGAGLWNGMP